MLSTQIEDFKGEDPRDEALSAARYRAGRTSTLVSIVVNIALVMLQVTAGVFSGSQALIADGIHSLSDLISDFVVLLAGHHSRKQADDDHQYGHQRYETAASLALGALLLAVGLGMLVSAAQKIQHYGETPPVHVAALWVALGIVGSLAGFTLLDPVAAAVVGLMVVRTGWGFFWSALHDLMDRAVSAEEGEAIRATILATPGVQGVHDLRTRRMGDLTLVDVHLEIDGTLTVTEGHAIAIDARSRVLAAHPVLDVMTHVDPVDAVEQGDAY
ncbi:cation transporter [Herbaspirillum huttiense]|uniref:cation diffusion facilitator family transporter n=1 Tax=Herbaspirillum huttiense TaxID=863372 RepID=UPI0010654287|nr:cation diffusion facilitator family transporter [Herbaspirillum huttiense]QBP74053.1 cation transporter [Herbaspirillum huttiense]